MGRKTVAEKVVKTVCHNCLMTCGIDVHIVGDRITKTGPMKESVLATEDCPRIDPQMLMEWVHSKDRVRKPLRRVNGELKETSWEDALDFISEELLSIKQQYGAKAVDYHTGNAFLATHIEKVARRFCDLYGTPNFTSGGSYCFYSRRLAHLLTLNHGAGIYAHPNWDGARCTIIWGMNPDESERHAIPDINAMQARGGKLIVIDPRVIPLAKQADVYAQVRPGTDLALALAMLNVIIEEKLYDQDFVEKWTFGFDKLAAHVKQYPPEKVAEITWVPSDTIKAMARTYARSKPANIVLGVAVDHTTNGLQAHRAIISMVAITGNIDIPGGNVWTPRGIPFTNLRLADRVSEKEGIGAEYPIYSQFARERQAMCVLDAILDEKPYPMKGLIVHGCEPMREWPNTSRVERAFRKLQLLVVIDVYMTDTAKLAHVVLPSAGFLERQSWKDYANRGIPVVALGEQALPSVGDSREDWKIVSDLGTRMGFGDYFPWQNAEELFQYLLDPTGITVAQLKRKPGGISYAKWEPKRYIREGFDTPSGKVELYSEILQKHGYDPLPTFEEPTESPVSRPDLAQTYPLILVTGPKTRFLTHSRFRNIPSLRKDVPEPVIEVNSKTATSLGIRQGDMVTVESPRGSIRLKALVTEDIHPKVVSIQHGWTEANANLLVDDAARDPISGYPAFKTNLCRVKK